MKPEHTKEFNAEHAQAGAPYCQRNGLAARIGIWDGRRTDYPLVGEAKYPGGNYHEVSWTSSGIFSLAVSSEGRDLVMLPLGMCEGKPVFVGDELENTLPNSSRFIVSPGMNVARDNFRWPRVEPVMPRFNLQISRSATNTPTDTGFSEIIAQHLLRYGRIKIEAYWKALDEFNGVKA